MGKYNNLARAAKKLAQVDQRIAMEKWRKLLAENIVDKPGFWDAYLANPPLPKNFTVSGKLPEIRFPEDDLYRVYKKRNEDWQDEVIKNHSRAREENEKTRGFLFVTQWMKYIENGMDKEDAYHKVDEEFRAIEGKMKDREIDAEVQQLITGKHPGFERWIEEEEIYVQEAYAALRLQWEADRRAKKVAENTEEERLAALEEEEEEKRKESREAAEMGGKKIKGKKGEPVE